MVLQPQRKLVIFGINLPKRGIPPYVIFKNKIWIGRESQIRTLVLNFTVVALKCGLTGPKIAKNGNFWYKFAHKGKSWGSIEKFEYRCTTTNLPVCNGTIIVLKIALLHSVSVITNFVIRKRNK